MKLGDYFLMIRNLGSLLEYVYYFFCSGIDEISGKLKIIYYYNILGNVMKQLFLIFFGFGLCFEQLGKIQEVILFDGDLIVKNDVDLEIDLLRVEVERVVWLDEL